MKRVFAWLVFVFVSHYTLAQGVDNNELLQRIDKNIQENMQRWQIPGLAIAIVKDGKTVFMKGYGVTKVGGKQKVDKHTLFMIGSNTKAFTGTAIALLHARRKLNLNDRVQKWLPSFRLKDPLAAKEASIADLLSHRLGFKTFQGDFVYWGSKLSRTEVVQKMGLIDAPYSLRTRWGYCNAAFVAAGELTAKVAGQSWETYIRSQILKPLGMNETLMLSEEFAKASNIAQPHSLVAGKLASVPIINIDNLAPAGSMASNVQDMATWLNAQVYDGKPNGKQLIPGRVFRITRIPQSILGTNQRHQKATHFYLYGLGLSINDRKGKLVYSHTGGVNGFLSSVVFVPEDKLGIVVLTNSDQNNFFEHLTDKLRDLFLKVPVKNNDAQLYQKFVAKKQTEQELIDSLKKVVAQKNSPNIALKKFAGKYHNKVYGEVEIKKRKGKLILHFANHPQLKGQLEYLKDNHFLCTYSDYLLGVKAFPFEVSNGKVKSFVLSVNGFVEYTTYKFLKKSPR
ncbi:serine hydrolase [Microscilla marina]|uniref:Beta-lactamase, putative n=1 Tax=Microscilla marina ATCC 23134 TaxID=313606 RepID=A1ZLA3_MICM2|nr:serine hydrolase [Microscilla marina]EAY28657.1 beta-lactamase, putative [Microscilla marina ATCC 23134]